MIRLFDIVKPKDEYVLGNAFDENETVRQLRATGVVTETDGKSSSVEWFDKEAHLHAAWWREEDLEVISNIMCIIGNAMAHPFGKNTNQGDKLFTELK